MDEGSLDANFFQHIPYLEESIEAKGYDLDYTVKVHALKSTAMTIGAERLAEEARLLEQAGKEGNTGYIRHGHPILLHLYDQVCETITGL